MDYVEMVVDSVRLALINYQKRVILKEKDGERCLTIWVDDAGADAIRAALLKVQFREPYTWNPLGDTTSKLGAVLKQVVIVESKEDILQAKAFLEKEGIIEISCKPSDALAGAVRAEAPIFVDEAILTKSGITVN